MSGIVYIIDENNLIVGEKKMDFDYAVQNFYGKRDNKGRRYHISVEGQEVPYKRKPKLLLTGRKQDT